MPALADRRGGSSLDRPPCPDGLPMPSYSVNHAEWQARKAAEIHGYVTVNKLTWVKACRLAGVSDRWARKYRDLIASPPTKARQRAS